MGYIVSIGVACSCCATGSLEDVQLLGAALDRLSGKTEHLQKPNTWLVQLDVVPQTQPVKYIL